MNTTKLKQYRYSAFLLQSGLCYYCQQPIWLEEPKTFSKTYHLSSKQCRLFRCTAEHLLAQQDGGGTSKDNIVAACYYCNQLRHKRKKPMNPPRFKAYVYGRMKRGGWNRMTGG